MNLGTVENSHRVVLDTNILVSAFIFGGKPEKVLRLVLTKKTVAYISSTLIAEITETLTKKFNFNQIHLKQIERKIRRNFNIVNPNKILKVVRDEDDNRVLEAAWEGKCDFIITGDKDLLDLKVFKNIKIVTADQFLKNVGE